MAETFLPFDLTLARAELARVWESLANHSGSGLLRAALRTAYNSVAGITQTGLIISATATQGHSTSFSVPGTAGASPQTRQLLYQHLIELADDLSAVVRDPVLTDATLYADMMLNLQSATHYQNDFTSLRY